MRSPAILLSIILGLTATSASAQLIGARIPSQGTCHVVALFATFPDEVPDEAASPSWAQDLFDPDGPGSFTHFYDEMSLGRFSVRGEVLPTSYTSDRRPDEYPVPQNDTEGYFGTFNLEVLRKADQDVDFGRFDNDGPDGFPNSGDDDGYVDFLFLFLPARNTPNGFFPLNASGIAELGFRDDFTTDDPAPSGYIKIASRLGATQRVWNRTSAVGIMAHEFGHALGLPELYDRFYDGPEDDSGGIGNWGLMGRGALGWDGTGGPAPLCAWSREQLEWTNVVEITGHVDDQVLTDVATTGTVYKIYLSEEPGYYLLENRQSTRNYYDRDIPRSGLLIWHIRSQAGTPKDPNTDESHKGVDLVCADGLYLDRGYPAGIVAAPDSGRDNLDFWAHDKYEAYRTDRIGNLGDTTDVFDGIRFTKFTPDTNPRSREGIRIENIRRSGTDMIADFRIPSKSGEITEDVTWEGLVNVTGDIVVQEGVTLTIHSGTVVRFSPEDALGSGIDPERCEIDVLGTLRIRTMGNAKPVRFTAEGKGTWVGIRLHERTAAIRWYMNPEIRVEDCDRPEGIFWAKHPDAKRPEVLRGIVQDDGEGCNGDGALNPGETVRLVLDIHNWTRKPFRATLSIDDRFVTDPMIPPFGTVIPGRTERSAGSLTIASDCPEGHQISVNVEFADFKGGETWNETFSLPVNGDPTEYGAALAVENGDGDPSGAVPKSFALGQNYPNPFNAETAISFDLPRPAEVTLTIFDAAGQRIKVWEGSWSAGHQSITWDGQDEYGSQTASGVYFYRLEAGGYVESSRMTLIK